MTATISPEVLVHQLFGAFLLPPLLFILPIALGLLLRRRAPAMGASLVCVGLLLAYLLSIPRTAMWLNGGLERYPVVSTAQLQQQQAIVVLGGGKKPAPEYDRNEPSADTQTRLRYAAFLARRTHLPLLVTGGSPYGGEPEGEVMARTLQQDYGLSVRWVEMQSNTTLENARYSALMLKKAGISRIVLVSQGWHLLRALPFFQAQGLNVLPAPTGFVRYDGAGMAWYLPTGRAMQECHSALREWLGIFFYSVQGWLHGRATQPD
ncbi:membrane protein [Aquitalea magnusonii]|nr:membrane protein [Aquitalea magnusonii]